MVYVILVVVGALLLGIVGFLVAHYNDLNTAPSVLAGVVAAVLICVGLHMDGNHSVHPASATCSFLFSGFFLGIGMNSPVIQGLVSAIGDAMDDD